MNAYQCGVPELSPTIRWMRSFKVVCGICGIVSAMPITGEISSRVRCMTATMIHRGPDSGGAFHDNHICLGVRRLSVIDTAGGSQPLYNEDRSLVLIANGEIYNSVELQARLEAKGHRFRTNSDCETILHLYEEAEDNCVHYLRGMFAFALWDTRKSRLLLARDRMGEKPLYLYRQPNRLVFASELKALLRSGLVRFELDPQSVDLYFHYQYVPEPLCPIVGVRKLDAAHLLSVDVGQWKINEKCYWRMEEVQPIEGHPATVIRRQLEEVSEIVIRSDVPVGVALSGGLDSSSIAALTARKYPGTMHAFSVGYPGGPHCDETNDAKELADYLSIPFHRVEVNLQEMATFFPQLVYWRDDPITDISGYGYYSVMKAAREHGVPVMLQGHGGDELFWGYRWTRQAVLESQRKALMLTSKFRGLSAYMEIDSPGDLTPLGFAKWLRNQARKCKAGAQAALQHFAAPTEQMIFYDVAPDFKSARQGIREIYTPWFISRIIENAPFQIFTLPHPWPRPDLAITRLVCDTYLRENGVAQGDRLSMASSVELRLPLLDYRLVETVMGLRMVTPDVELEPKAWLKAAVSDLLPAWVVERPKRGFTPPVMEWHKALFEAHGSDLVDGYLVRSEILLERQARKLAKGPYQQGSGVPVSFKALVLEVWCRRMSSICFDRAI
jgi:asparagine synthase (glutamine-hydrolysing)